MSTKTEIQVRGLSLYAEKPTLTLSLEENGQKTEIECLRLINEDIDVFQYELQKCFQLQLTPSEGLRALNFFTPHKYEEDYFPVRSSSREGIYVQKINPELKISLYVECPQEDSSRNGLYFSDKLKFIVRFGYFWKAEWHKNIVRLYFLPELNSN